MKLVPYYENRMAKPYATMGDLIDSFFKSTYENGWADSFKVDVQKTDREYIVKADLPGVKKENIQLEVEDGVLTIGVQMEENHEEKNEETNYLHRERRVINTSRSISVGDVEEDRIQAKLEDGVLIVTLPIQEEAVKKRSIEIQ
ncbi:MAG: Hsp20/alpha crystallin family protein [Peptoniphilaceae bacterium]|nr:Hsp20/alpha crystallin family protein [Peptoniphilaceae bacterium]MCI6660047.1 Hsp20/alpha crystallin family protein [Peptoniphilaceae bacterium]MDD7433510.1 Hsp20/alpha crystallin family protein [Peptoniphilaceae bacterium]MDY3075723.1 Hsp20/alpha crystallin family protein [Peptoniphilaceae bacterium]MDY3987632.1 Hsp20/alpha crystallin family protein [Peptoniphilaceae bacterium]